MSVTLEQIKALRDATGISTSSCKKALLEANGDMKTAIEMLRKKGEAKAIERNERQTGEGIISSYVHTNKKIGVLVELTCETDFVAKNRDFQNLGQDLAMHVAAMNPKYLNPEEIPNETIEYENALLTQTFVKNPEMTVEKLINEHILKLGENIKIKRFIRFSI